VSERIYEQESTAALLVGILQDGKQLLRDEIELAKLELQEQTGRMRRTAVDFAVGGLLVGLAVLFFAVALSLGLSTLFGWDAWAGFALVGAAAAAVGAPWLWRARARARHAHLRPREAVASLYETGRWLRSKVG